MQFRLFTLSSLTLSLLSFISLGYAQDKPIQLETIVVTAEAGSVHDAYFDDQTDLQGLALKRSLAPTIGDTVNKVVGVQSSNFGPASSLPVIHSLSGHRVGILNNGMDVNQVAAISGNLPTTVEPLFADSIQIEKDRTAVLYGGQALGGAINVKDSRIPYQVPEGEYPQTSVELRYGYNSGQTQIFRADGGNQKNWAWHIDALKRQISDIHIPGDSKAPFCHDENAIYTSGEFAGVDSRLAGLCQVNASVVSKVNPAYYRFLNAAYDPSNSEDSPYTNTAFNSSTLENNPPNPAYIPNSPYYISSRQPIRDLVPYKQGYIPNSHQQQLQMALGTSYIGSQGYFGIGFSRYLNRYGVPGFASLNTKTAADNARLPVDIQSGQSRWAVEGLWTPQNDWIQSIQLNSAYSDSINGEYLGNTLSSHLNSRETQARIEVKRQEQHGWRGIYGIDWKYRQIRTDGADRYLPQVNTQKYGIFALESLQRDFFTLEAGLRLEHLRHTLQEDNFLPDRGKLFQENRQFSLSQKHLALQWTPTDDLRFRWQRTLSQRAPEVNELYAGNNHFAIWTHEGGQGNLSKEKSYTTTWSAHWQHQGFHSDITYYMTQFDNFLYLGQTGITRLGLPEKQWRQADQKINGLDIELGYQWQTENYGDWEIRSFADLVKSSPLDNSNKRESYDGRYLPGLPVSRYGLSIDWQQQNWQVGTSLVHYQKQKYRGNYYLNSPEPALPSYTLWDAYIGYQHPWQGHNIHWSLSGQNLTNAEARPYNSPLKYLSPLAGRSLTLAMRIDF